MKYIAVAALATLIHTGSTAAAGTPAPDPPPGATHPATIVWAYSYVTHTRRGHHKVVCHVPVHGRRVCRIVR